MIFSNSQLNLLHQNHNDPNPNKDPFPVVKLFTPFANATWLLTELDPDNNDLAFGLCDLGLQSPELGYVSITEILSLKIPVEQDLYCILDKPLSHYTKESRKNGRIVT